MMAVVLLASSSREFRRAGLVSLSSEAFEPFFSFSFNLNDVPNVFSSMAELAACYAGAEAVVADTDGVVLVFISKVVSSFCHCANEDAYAFLGTEGLNVVFDSDHWALETHGHLSAVWWQVICNWIFDDSQQLLVRSRRADGMTLQELDHQAGKALEGAGNANRRIDLDQDTLGCVNVYLQLAGLVDWRVEECEKTLRALLAIGKTPAWRNKPDG
jgi:hypothetical protein